MDFHLSVIKKKFQDECFPSLYNYHYIEELEEYIENIANDGFEGHLVVSSSDKVQVHFIGEDNQLPSWILCQIGSTGICSFD